MRERESVWCVRERRERGCGVCERCVCVCVGDGFGDR